MKIEYIDEEVPLGNIDGENRVFTITKKAVDGSLKLFLNGLRLHSGEKNDYKLLGKKIIMNIVPFPKDKILVDYRVEDEQ